MIQKIQLIFKIFILKKSRHIKKHLKRSIIIY
jgi:hypothetical protein